MDDIELSARTLSILNKQQAITNEIIELIVAVNNVREK